MRLYLDENESVAMLPPLRQIYYQHEFRSCRDEKLEGIDDVTLFGELRERGFDAIVTRDRVQLTAEELDALLANNLHWIGHREPPLSGLGTVAMLASAYLSALHYIFPVLQETTEPMKFAVRNIPHVRDQRVRITPLRGLRRK